MNKLLVQEICETLYIILTGVHTTKNTHGIAHVITYSFIKDFFVLLMIGMKNGRKVRKQYLARWHGVPYVIIILALELPDANVGSCNNNLTQLPTIYKLVVLEYKTCMLTHRNTRAPILSGSRKLPLFLLLYLCILSLPRKKNIFFCLCVLY